MNEKTKREIGIVWRAFMALSVAVMCIILIYLMWTGQDIKNIHVAVVVIAAIWSIDKPEKPEPTRPPFHHGCSAYDVKSGTDDTGKG